MRLAVTGYHPKFIPARLSFQFKWTSWALVSGREGFQKFIGRLMIVYEPESSPWIEYHPRESAHTFPDWGPSKIIGDAEIPDSPESKTPLRFKSLNTLPVMLPPAVVNDHLLVQDDLELSAKRHARRQ
ncbi:MAG TPA: hypothetical protein VES59_11460 [Bacteroidota bacterium]|nr:hypothetical protein [Bacteroidota bacterium]